MTTYTNDKEVSVFQDTYSDSKERVITSIQRKYSAIQVMASSRRNADEEEHYRAVEQEAKESADLLKSLDANNPLMAMLATQMAAIHDLQQKEFLFASQIVPPEERQFHIIAVTKLSNVFIQQVTLMQKLQGKGQQKVTVEHVHVHNGGQAIVGNVEQTGGRGSGEK